MQRNERPAEADATIAAGLISAVNEGHAAAEDVLQLGGPFPLKDLFEDDMRWYSFLDDVNGGWLKTEQS